MKLSIENKTNILMGIFVGALISANLIGLKVADFVLFPASVGILLFPILFLITDIVEEVHGKKKAREFVIVGFITLLIILIVTIIAVLLPHVSRSVMANEDLQIAYDKIFGTTIRIFIASITAFLIAQFHDIWAFNFWKQKTKGKYLWLRNNLSTIISQFIDTTLFMFIAFYGVTDTAFFDLANTRYTVEFVFFTMTIPYWLVKVLFALFDTPFCYLGVKWLKSSKKHVKSKSI